MIRVYAHYTKEFLEDKRPLYVFVLNYTIKVKHHCHMENYMFLLHVRHNITTRIVLQCFIFAEISRGTIYLEDLLHTELVEGEEVAQILQTCASSKPWLKYMAWEWKRLKRKLRVLNKIGKLNNKWIKRNLKVKAKLLCFLTFNKPFRLLWNIIGV